MMEYQVLNQLEKNPAHTQRTLAQTLNISLGKANYVLSGLIEKGIVKAKKVKNHPDKIRWQYNLTPAGVKEKIIITREYLNKRLAEYNSIKIEIDELQKTVGAEAVQN